MPNKHYFNFPIIPLNHTLHVFFGGEMKDIKEIIGISIGIGLGLSISLLIICITISLCAAFVIWAFNL